jgi:hypothetical protein
VLNGDVFDFYAISKFNRDPQRRFLLQEEIDLGVEYMDALVKACGKQCKKKVFNIGNHTIRLETFLFTKAPELSGLRSLSLGKLLCLAELGFSIHGEKNPFIFEDCYYFHGRKYSKNAAYSATAYLKELQKSHVSGHHHHLAITHITAGPNTLFGIEGGHLCDVSKLDYTGINCNWQAGFVYQTYSSHFQNHIYEIKEL